MTTSSYDLVVVGDDLAGLIAAALCARRGMRVLVVRHTPVAMTYRIGELELPVFPQPVFGLDRPAVRRVTDELALAHLLKRKLRESEPSFQLVAPDLRINVDVDDGALSREVMRERPGDEDRAMALFARASAVADTMDAAFAQDIAVPPTGFWEKRELARIAGQAQAAVTAWTEAGADAGELAALLAGPAALCSRASEVAEVAVARWAALWRGGTPRLAGDLGELRAMFIEKLKSHNGEVKEAACTDLAMGWGKATGCVLDSGEEVGASHVIAALPAAELVALCGKKPPKRLVRLAETQAPTAVRYTLNLAVAEAGIPEGMARAVIAAGQGDEPPMAIYVAEPDDEARVVISIQTNVPTVATGAENLASRLVTARAQIRRRLEDLMPFVWRHVIACHSPNESLPPEGTTDAVDLPAPVDAPFLWSPPGEDVIGLGCAPYDIGIKRLLLASDQTLPELGFEGAFVTGWSAAKLVSTAAGKKRDHIHGDLAVMRG